MIPGETIGSLTGDKLDHVVCSGISACVTDGDLVKICTFIRTSGKNRASAAVIKQHLGWPKEKVTEALEKLYALDVLTDMMGEGARYTVKKSELDEFLDSHQEEPTEEEPVPEAEPVPEKVRLSAPLKGIDAPAPKAKKAKKSAVDSVDDMLASIASMPRKHCFEGAERESKIAETFSRLEELVNKLNTGLEALDRVSEKVKFSRTPASIVRIYPEDESGNGGIVITYRDFVLTGDWEPDMTQSWCDRKVEKVAAWTAERLKHAIAVAKRG